jgi:hypothetical protein
MGTAVKKKKVLHVALIYVTEVERPLPPTNANICWHTLHSCLFVCLESKEFNTFGGHVTAHLYENCVVLVNMILCSNYRICVWCCREGSGSE